MSDDSNSDNNDDCVSELVSKDNNLSMDSNDAVFPSIPQNFQPLRMGGGYLVDAMPTTESGSLSSSPRTPTTTNNEINPISTEIEI